MPKLLLLPHLNLLSQVINHVVQKVMESGTRKAKGSRTVSLFLSHKLRRLRYGFEYGVLEVKNHLEKLLFSDIVSTVMIV